jgi:hypothetical protein
MHDNCTLQLCTQIGIAIIFEKICHVWINEFQEKKKSGIDVTRGMEVKLLSTDSGKNECFFCLFVFLDECYWFSLNGKSKVESI